MLRKFDVLLIALFTLCPATFALAQDRPAGPGSTQAPTTVGRSLGDAPQSGVPWSAPVGHRQPRPADIPPAVREQEATDPAAGQLDSEIDSKLKICRNC